MALVTRNADASMDASTGMFAPQITGLVCGEDIDAGAACYIAQSDGNVYMFDGTAADVKAVFAGFSPRAAKLGQPITIFGAGARFSYSTALTPGQKLYGAATKGRLDTAATTGDAVGLAQAINATDIRVTRMI